MPTLTLLRDLLQRVPGVLGEQPPALPRGPGEDLVVGHRPQVRSLGDRDDVVAQIAERGCDRGREHLVEREPGTGRLAHAMSCCWTRQASSARADASSAASISASISAW